ncbi:CobW family GTP-binding protein [Novosphingobium sp. BL-52-GroH]|uniref:CobW family GTP-binding protein n=1 Tax=Novosphingobium sp. BL-52-GroH TaxID=3349877 RepID=UPI00384E8D90
MTTGPIRLPLLLLTGFLGSGKTTLLNRLLKHPVASATAVIINEFGEISIDDALIERRDGNTMVLNSGCVCCSVRDSLAVTLDELFESRRAGTIPMFDRVVLETTGLADPGPILRLLATEPKVAGRYAICLVATTIDSVNAATTLAAHPQAVRQVARADLLLLTKTDLADPQAVAALRGTLIRMNPLAQVAEARDDDTIEALLSDRFQSTVGSGLMPPSLAPDAEQHDHADHLHGIETFVYRHAEALPWTAFATLLSRLNLLASEDLLRVKGLVFVAGQPGPVVIHGVQQLIHAPTVLPAWPDAQTPPSTRIVCIARPAAIAPLRQIFTEIFA